jgi:hypothetical protein
MCMGKICCNFIMWSLLNYCSMDKIFVEETFFCDRWEFHYNLVDEVEDL